MTKLSYKSAKFDEDSSIKRKQTENLIEIKNSFLVCSGSTGRAVGFILADAEISLLQGVDDRQ